MIFEKCILPYNHYHTKNVEHFHHPSNSHTSLCSHSTHSTTTNVGLRPPLPSFCHCRLVLPFWEFHINEIICHILSSHKRNGKARETPSNRMGVTETWICLVSLPWHNPNWSQPSCWTSMAHFSSHALAQAAFLGGTLYSLPLSFPHAWSHIPFLGPHLPTGKVNNKGNPWKSIFAEEFANLWGEPDRKCAH